MVPGALNETSQERQAYPAIGCSTETGSNAGKVFSRASSSACSWRLRLSLSPSSLRFAFRISNHFGFSDDANFGELIDERYPFRVIRLPYNVLMATRPSAVFPPLERVGS